MLRDGQRGFVAWRGLRIGGTRAALISAGRSVAEIGGDKSERAVIDEIGE